LLCGRTSAEFRAAIELLMHELIHVRQWETLDQDSFLNNYLIECMLVGYGSDSFESEAFELEARVSSFLASAGCPARPPPPPPPPACRSGTRCCEEIVNNRCSGACVANNRVCP